MKSKALREEIQNVLNCHSAENGSDTPDFILAKFLTDCLAAWDHAVQAREKWYGRPISAGLRARPLKMLSPLDIVTGAPATYEAERERVTGPRHEGTGRMEGDLTDAS